MARQIFLLQLSQNMEKGLQKLPREEQRKISQNLCKMLFYPILFSEKRSQSLHKNEG